MYTLQFSRGIPLQIAKQDKQGETRAFRNGVQNIQITDGGQQYEIIQKTEDVDHEETQQGKLFLYKIAIFAFIELCKRIITEVTIRVSLNKSVFLVVQMEETQFEERVTWGDDGTGHAGTIQAPNLEVMREETIEADQTEQQTNGQQGKNHLQVLENIIYLLEKKQQSQSVPVAFIKQSVPMGIN